MLSLSIAWLLSRFIFYITFSIIIICVYLSFLSFCHIESTVNSLLTDTLVNALLYLRTLFSIPPFVPFFLRE